jgi:formate hydrogenlyase subunit 3/multisubunit Na+/H+ antiporter MnhD subunit
MNEPQSSSTPGRHELLWPIVGALLAIGVWTVSTHAYFVGFLLSALTLPLVRSRLGFADRRGRFDMVPPLIVLGLVLAHGLLPFSKEVEIAALLVVGGAFPFHLWLEALQPRLPSLEFLALLIVQSGLALAVQILGPQTAMLDPTVRTWLAGWFVATAVIHSGLSLVRRDPLRAIFAVGLSQSSLLVAGGIASEEGFAAEELMLAGTNLGLISLVLILDDLRRRFGLQRLAPDNALAAVSPTLSRLFLVAGWLFVGLPGGIVFFAEDLVFHTLLERSTAACTGMILASVLNGVCFYRVYLGVFSGRPRPVIYALGEERAWLAPLLVVLALATILFGLWPQLLLAQLH